MSILISPDSASANVSRRPVCARGDRSRVCFYSPKGVAFSSLLTIQMTGATELIQSGLHSRAQGGSSISVLGSRKGSEPELESSSLEELIMSAF